jgi:hypothetical protein
MTTTPLSNKIDILAQLLIVIQDDERYSEFYEFHSLMLHMAYLLHNDMVETIKPRGIQYLDMTWQALLDKLGISDTGFSTLDDILGERELVL